MDFNFPNPPPEGSGPENVERISLNEVTHCQSPSPGAAAPARFVRISELTPRCDLVGNQILNRESLSTLSAYQSECCNSRLSSNLRVGSRECLPRWKCSFASSSWLTWVSKVSHVSSGSHYRSDPVRVQSTTTFWRILEMNWQFFASRVLLWRLLPLKGVPHLALCSARATRGWPASKLAKPTPQRKIGVTSKTPVGVISVVTLIRTDTTLDHSQKAEKVC